MLEVVFTVVGYGLVAALLLAAVHVTIGILLAPVWAAGRVLHVETMRRIGGGWWLLPFVILEAADSLLAKATAPRDGSRWKRPHPAPPVSEQGTYAADADPSSDWARTLGTLLLWGLAIVGGFAVLIYGHDSLLRPSVGGAIGEWVSAAVTVAAVAAGVTAWVLSQRYRYDSRPPLFRFSVAAAVVLAVAGWMLWMELDDANELVRDYCAYGSRSQAQLDGCVSHVTANHIRSLSTPASRFAQDWIDAECGARSGPFCDEVLRRRALEDMASEY